MKLIKISYLLILLFTLNGFSQAFKVTPNGFIDSEDKDNKYIVIDMPSKTAKELYDESFKFIQKTYKNPDEAIKSKIENEYLKFSTYSDGFIRVKQGYIKMNWNARYTIELSFRDNKIKYEIIELEMSNDANSYPLNFSAKGIGFYIYNSKDGTLKMEDAKIQIENYFDSEIQFYVDFLTKTEIKEEW
jgi:hypothetical protein